MSNTPKLCDLFIADCTLLTETYTIREHVSVAIRDSRIVEIGEHTAMAGAYQAAQTISGAGKLLMPGFVDGHTHVCQQLLRGRSGGHMAMNWTGVLVPWESSLTPQDVRVSTRMACLEMIKAGFTSFADAGGVHMDQAAEGILESGMRAAICRSTMDIGDVVSDKMKESIPDTMRRFRELYDAYDEIEDRYGTVPQSVYQLMEVARLKAAAQKAGVTEILGSGDKVIYRFDEKRLPDFTRLLQLVQARPKEFFLPGSKEPKLHQKLKKPDAGGEKAYFAAISEVLKTLCPTEESEKV